MIYVGGNLYISNAVYGSGSHSLSCFNPQNPTGNCTGGKFPIAVPYTGAGSVGNYFDLAPYDPTGTGPIGFCMGLSGGSIAPSPSYGRCWDFLGNDLGRVWTPALPTLFYATRGLVAGTRLIMPSANTIQCVDYATNATCPGYPVPGLTFTRNDMYTVNRYTSDCFVTFSDKGAITYFDPITPRATCAGNGMVSKGKAYMEASAAADPNCTATAQWTNVTLVSAPDCTFTNASVTFLDAADVPIAGYTGVPIPSALPYTVQLNSGSFPRLTKLKIEISMVLSNASVPGATCGVTSKACGFSIDATCGFLLRSAGIRDRTGHKTDIFPPARPWACLDLT